MVVLLILLFSDLSAYDDTPRCFKDLQRSFFQREAVLTALSLHYREVTQSLWFSISSDLVAINYKIPQRMKEKAKRMNPDPFQNPFQPLQAQELLRETAQELFIEVMLRHELSDRFILEGVFKDIFESQIVRIVACLQGPIPAK